MSRQDFDTLNLPARQPPAASGLDQPIHRQVKQAQVGKRRRTGDGRAETEERETEDGGKANARSGASPIERTGSPENTVVSYAPWDFWATPASEGKKPNSTYNGFAPQSLFHIGFAAKQYTIAISFNMPDVANPPYSFLHQFIARTPKALNINPSIPARAVFINVFREAAFSGGTACTLTLATLELCASAVATSCPCNRAA